jgi:bidirectional [NiFe] hydrogenase diaphorase subunit
MSNTTTSTQAIPVTIDGRTSTVAAGTTVLEAARAMGIAIPTLCAYRGMSPYGACRVCIVELQGPRGSRQIASCSYPVEPNMVVSTDTPSIQISRKVIIELLLAQAPESEKLAAFAKEQGVESTSFKKAASGSCILCGLCVRTCSGDINGRSNRLSASRAISARYAEGATMSARRAQLN